MMHVRPSTLPNSFDSLRCDAIALKSDVFCQEAAPDFLMASVEVAFWLERFVQHPRQRHPSRFL
jgi:hypothetical protein